ncbi:hypothetical protein ABK040_000133 [Willaertia magna]
MKEDIDTNVKNENKLIIPKSPSVSFRKEVNDSNDIVFTKILMIYTGGTIGMKKSNEGYVPAKGYLKKKLSQLSQFNDEKHRKIYLKSVGIITNEDTPQTEQVKLEQWFATPRSDEGTVALYQLLEFDPILDSSNMGYKDWVKIAECISDHYNLFDVFIVLHGTDTMCYTSSALSFMFRNLAKFVILTGSQIPISQTRNDGFDNLLGAITIAKRLYIPEVCVFFHNKLFRGNRCTKVDASDLSAFDCPNIQPIAKFGIELEVNWSLIRRPPLMNQQFKLIPITNSNVGVLRIFPGISTQVLENFFRPPMEGVVLLTYGAGNVPSVRKDFLEAIKKASDRGVVIINCTQCHKGTVSASYKTGSVLYDECGVVSGSDMTTEAAVTKLMYLLSCDYEPEEIKRMITVDLRGELTPQQKASRYSLRDHGFVSAVCRALNTNSSNAAETDEVTKALLPVILLSVSAIGDLDEMNRLVEVDGADVNAYDYDKRTALHIAASEGQLEMTKYLVSVGANINARDRWGHTPYSEAKRFEQYDVKEYLESLDAEE